MIASLQTLFSSIEPRHYWALRTKRWLPEPTCDCGTALIELQVWRAAIPPGMIVRWFDESVTGPVAVDLATTLSRVASMTGSGKRGGDRA